MDRLAQEISKLKSKISGAARGAATSLIRRAPDRRKVEKIVGSLDLDEDGDITFDEVRVLFCMLADIPDAEIPEDDVEVIAFLNMTFRERVESICKVATHHQVNRHYAIITSAVSMVGGGPGVRKKPMSKRTAKLIQVCHTAAVIGTSIHSTPYFDSTPYFAY